MKYVTSPSKLMNYELKGSNSNNYLSLYHTSCPESFLALVGDGVWITYETLVFTTEILQETYTLLEEASKGIFHMLFKQPT